MSNYVSVDCGKFNTKVFTYDQTTDTVRRYKFRTKCSEGSFDDDMISKGTYVVQVDDGKVYTIGNEAKVEADLNTSKKSEIHKVCTLAAMAMAVIDKDGKPIADTPTIHAVIGIPLQMAFVTDQRLSYKDYIYGDEGQVHKVTVKRSANEAPITVKFAIKKRLVYPEAIGVLYEFPKMVNGPTAIIDIGNLNINNIYADGFNIVRDACFTDELGGNMLISSLAQELTNEIGLRCDDSLAMSTLRKPYDMRYLTPVNRNAEVEAKSRQIIDRVVMEHVGRIKAKCASKKWPLDFMNVICIGGTSELLAREIHAVFGDLAFIPADPEFVNASGFLKKMCADEGLDLANAFAKYSTRGNAANSAKTVKKGA